MPAAHITPSIPRALLIPPRDRDGWVNERGEFRVAALCDLFGLTAARFGDLVGRPARDVTKLVRSDSARPHREETRRVLAELVQLASLLAVLGVDSPGAWLQLPLPSYGGRTPAELIRDDLGQQLIAELLAHAAG